MSAEIRSVKLSGVKTRAGEKILKRLAAAETGFVAGIVDQFRNRLACRDEKLFFARASLPFGGGGRSCVM
tara:strand:+ start:8660 stop:8869 length:210 start_codon:yes stop_codon:yes gene_type:complete